MVINYMIFNLGPELLTGHVEIDDQHRYLFSLVDDLQKCVIDNNQLKAIELFSGFLDHIINHFTYEEMLMYKVKYPEPELRRHRLAHRTLQEIYLVAYKPVLLGTLPVSMILELFESHFIHHLCEEDLLLATFIQKKQLENESSHSELAPNQPEVASE